MPTLINYTENIIDANEYDLQFQGDLGMNIVFVQSSCMNVSVGDYATFNFDCLGVGVLSYEGTAVPVIDTVNDRLEFTTGGTIYNIVLNNGHHYPIAEGAGSVSYNAGDPNNYMTWTGGTWDRQDTYHYNLYNGFTFAGAVRLPYQVGGVYSNPAIPNGHNNAETLMTMAVLYPELAHIDVYYNQTTFAPLIFSLSDLAQGLADEELEYEVLPNGSVINLVAYSEGDRSMCYKFRERRYPWFRAYY